jgi:hypothetical protein
MAADMTMGSWYGAHKGNMFGPTTYGQLVQLFARNEVDYVWCDALSDWQPAWRLLAQERDGYPRQNTGIDARQQGTTYTVVEGASVKLATVIWILVGILIPLWPVSLPVCWYRAYRSYKRPTCHTFVLTSI